MPSLVASNGDDDARDRDGNLLLARAVLFFIGFVLAFDCGYSACTWGLSTRSNACYYGADLAALPGRRSGRSPRRRTEQHWMHGFQHLAKVRVAGSNPVVRSKESPGHGRARG